MRNLSIEGSYNVRDLGGYATGDGQSTRWHTFIRAGNLDKVSAAGSKQLIDYGVKTIIDLRDEWEVESYPNVFAQASDVQYINLPLIGNRLSWDENWKAASEKYSQLHELYSTYLDECQPQIGAIMAAIAESTAGTVFHCHAGKDRTGLIAALVLGAVGVADEAIAADYAQTNDQIAPLVAEWRSYALKHNRDMADFERDSASAPQTMIDTLSHLRARYGGVTAYLAGCGVTEGQLKQLHSGFVVNNAQSDD